jgi:hypothetical protein
MADNLSAHKTAKVMASSTRIRRCNCITRPRTSTRFAGSRQCDGVLRAATQLRMALRRMRTRKRSNYDSGRGSVGLGAGVKTPSSACEWLRWHDWIIRWWRVLASTLNAAGRPKPPAPARPIRPREPIATWTSFSLTITITITASSCGGSR